jgi:PKD repeat protein
MYERVVVCVAAIAVAGLLSSCQNDAPKEPPARQSAVPKKKEPKPTVGSVADIREAVGGDFLVWAEAEPDEGPPPLTVRFTVEALEDAELAGAKYEWDFGDGSPVSTDARPTHTYSKLGTYEARLKVTDSSGKVGNDIAFIYVEDEEEEVEGEEAGEEVQPPKEPNPV